VLMEAMANGLPPVAFACPCGPKDMIHNGDDGILCENGNTERLAEDICQLIENEPLRKEMGQKATQSMKQFSLENIMHQWNGLFQEIDKKHAKEA